MQRVSVFDWYTRTADDRVDGALSYFEITNEEAEEVERWAMPDEYDNVVEWKLIEETPLAIEE